MLYTAVRPIARIALGVFFRKIYFTNADVVPKDKPIILAANHPTAFLEPCLLACFQPLSLNYLVRGDLFVKPFYKKLLNGLHMVPVYRLKDGGYQKIKDNYATFRYCYDALNKKKPIMILAEGSTIHEKRLRKLQKGTGRLAFGAIENYEDLDIYIVPVGVNYTYADQFRKEVMIDFGQPIRLKEYWETYQENNAKGHRELMKALETGLKERVIHINEKADEALVEHLLVLNRNDHPDKVWPIVERTTKPLFREKSIADKVNLMNEEEKSALKLKTNNYFNELNQLKIDDQSLIQPRNNGYDNTIILMAGFLPFLFGYIGNFLPAWLASYVERTKVKSVEFKTSVQWAVGIGAFLIYYIILLSITISYNTWIAWLLFLLLPVWGYFSLVYMELYQKWKKAGIAKKVDPEILNKLKAERLELTETI